VLHGNEAEISKTELKGKASEHYQLYWYHCYECVMQKAAQFSLQTWSNRR